MHYKQLDQPTVIILYQTHLKQNQPFILLKGQAAKDSAITVETGTVPVTLIQMFLAHLYHYPP